MIVGNPIIMILKAILNWFRLRRDYVKLINFFK